MKSIGRLWIVVSVLFTGCYSRDMVDQAKQKPLSASPMFRDGRSSRLPVEGTVARGQLFEDTHLYTGKVNGKLVTNYPFPVTDKTLEIGQEKFNVFCAPCHDRTGSGRGMIVQRGYGPPPSYHIDRLRESPEGYFFDVITNGYRTMPAYAAQIKPKERWAIVAYVRALQLSQRTPVKDLSTEERAKVTHASSSEDATEMNGKKESPHE
jgi:mono/diheme cytochrome c family protein